MSARRRALRGAGAERCVFDYCSVGEPLVAVAPRDLDNTEAGEVSKHGA